MTAYVKSIAAEFWATLLEMSPYLLFGFVVAGLLSMFVSQRLVEKHLSGAGLWPLLKASLLGVPLPLCSCGVIPVSMSLYKHGAGRGATIAFLLSTPQTGVDSIFVTYSLLGPVFAVFRPVAALITGLVGGALINVCDAPGAGPPEQAPCEQLCCRRDGPRQRVAGGLKYAFMTLPRDIGPAMFVGLMIAAVISAMVPEGYFAGLIGTGLGAMLVMMALGIPVYVCATASVPIAAAMIMKGVTPGAALVFLMTGPATNAASFTTIWRVLGRRTALLYLGSVAGCALAAGWALDFVAAGVRVEVVGCAEVMLPPAVKYASAAVLAAILAVAQWGRLRRREGHTADPDRAAGGPVSQ
ncbi:MAG TPA: permease [Phycisphaerales bacterium]|nr:permease [Phycisphaerales bacterium]